MEKPLIRTENLEITYNKGKSNQFLALQDVNVDIYAGEYIILFGPSGSGKSTLMYSILGSIRPSGGKLYVNDESVYDYSPEKMVYYQQKMVGIVFQKFNLINSLSVIDNVALPQIFTNTDAVVRLKKAQRILDRFGVGREAEKLPSSLSGGQQQRIAVARSLINDPEILLGDEPVGNLDSVSKQQVMSAIDEINKRDKKTIILVTHDASHLPHAHRVYYIDDGRVVREVANPEKEQIKKGGTQEIVTEIEKLGRLFPYLSINKLRVKSLVNYLTQGLDFDQLGQLEDMVEQMIDGRMNPETFLRLLCKNRSQGGIGLPTGMSKVMTETVITILKQSRDVGRFKHDFTEDQELGRLRYIERLTGYLIDYHGRKLSPTQEDRLKQAVSDRLLGYRKKDSFLKLLSTSTARGGVGLSQKGALNLSRYFEKLVAQGLEMIDYVTKMQKKK
jgi:putative ABC transport system ATP-binding protein